MVRRTTASGNDAIHSFTEHAPGLLAKLADPVGIDNEQHRTALERLARLLGTPTSMDSRAAREEILAGVDTILGMIDGPLASLYLRDTPNSLRRTLLAIAATEDGVAVTELAGGDEQLSELTAQCRTLAFYRLGLLRRHPDNQAGVSRWRYYATDFTRQLLTDLTALSDPSQIIDADYRALLWAVAGWLNKPRAVDVKSPAYRHLTQLLTRIRQQAGKQCDTRDEPRAGPGAVGGQEPPAQAGSGAVILGGWKDGELDRFERDELPELAHGIRREHDPAQARAPPDILEIPLNQAVLDRLANADMADLPSRLVGFYWAERDVVVIFTPMLGRVRAAGLLDRLLAHEDEFHRQGREHNDLGLTHDQDEQWVLWRLVRREFWRFWAARTAGDLTVAISSVVVPLLAVVAFGASAFQVSLLNFLTYGAGLLIALPAGALVDRVRARWLLIGIELARFALVVSMPLALFGGVLTLGQLYAVTALLGVVYTVAKIATLRFLPGLIGSDANLLGEANGRIEAGSRSALAAGPVVGSWLMSIRLLGPAGALLLGAASSLASVVALAWTRDPEAIAPPTKTAKPGDRSSRKGGLRFLLGHPVLRALSLYESSSRLFLGAISATQVVFLVRVLGASAFAVGMVAAVAFLGGLLGSVLGPRVAKRIGPARLLWLAPVLAAPVLLVYPFAPPGWPGLIVAGTVLAISQAVTQLRLSHALGHLQKESPQKQLGRVGAAFRFMSDLGVPLGALLGGAAAAALGLRPATALAMALAGVSSLLLVFSPLRGRRDLPDGRAPSTDSAPAPRCDCELDDALVAYRMGHEEAASLGVLSRWARELAPRTKLPGEPRLLSLWMRASAELLAGTLDGPALTKLLRRSKQGPLSLPELELYLPSGDPVVDPGIWLRTPGTGHRWTDDHALLRIVANDTHGLVRQLFEALFAQWAGLTAEQAHLLGPLVERAVAGPLNRPKRWLDARSRAEVELMTRLGQLDELTAELECIAERRERINRAFGNWRAPRKALLCHLAEFAEAVEDGINRVSAQPPTENPHAGRGGTPPSHYGPPVVDEPEALRPTLTDSTPRGTPQPSPPGDPPCAPRARGPPGKQQHAQPPDALNDRDTPDDRDTPGSGGAR